MFLLSRDSVSGWPLKFSYCLKLFLEWCLRPYWPVKTICLKQLSSYHHHHHSKTVFIVCLHWPKMKTLHFISPNNCFVSIHVVVRFMHAYSDIVADNDYAIFIQIPGLSTCQRLKNMFLTLHVLRNRWFINSFKTDKKTFAAEYWY